MESRKRIDLSGDWKFAMDPLRQAVNFCGGWYDYDLPDTVKLPGTTNTNGMGVEMKVKDVDHPNSRYLYVGSAWYQKEVDIPEALAGKRILLFMERTARTQVWMDQSGSESATRFRCLSATTWAKPCFRVVISCRSSVITLRSGLFNSVVLYPTV
jgi:beta-galactosidase/beta-glucuronidase